MEPIHITDVAPRDGLQNQKVAVSTEAKLQLVRLLAAAGVQSVEATSFVSPKAIFASSKPLPAAMGWS